MNLFQRLDDTIRWIKDSLLLILGLPLLVTVAWLWITLHGFLWFDGVQDKLTKAEQTIAKMELASKEATLKQERLNSENALLSQRIADDVTLHHEANAAAVDGAVAAYIAANRVRPDNHRCPVRASAAAVSGSAPASAGETQPTGLVAVSEYDLGRLAKAAVQGDEAADFLIQLVNAGLAVPDTKHAP